MSRVFKSYTRSENVVLIPDMPAPPGPSAEEGEALPEEQALSERVQEQAAELLAKAQEQAQREKEEARSLAEKERAALLAAAGEEAERIREQARIEGAERGRREKQAEISNGLQALADTLLELRQRHHTFLQESGQGLKLLAVDIAEKIIDQKIAEDDAALTGLVKKAVQSIRDADWITVEISANLPQLVQKLEEELGAGSSGARVEVALRDLPDSGVWVQTPDGAVDASLSTQVANLKEIFSQMDEA